MTCNCFLLRLPRNRCGAVAIGGLKEFPVLTLSQAGGGVHAPAGASCRAEPRGGDGVPRALENRIGGPRDSGLNGPRGGSNVTSARWDSPPVACGDSPHVRGGWVCERVGG